MARPDLVGATQTTFTSPDVCDATEYIVYDKEGTEPAFTMFNAVTKMHERIGSFVKRKLLADRQFFCVCIVAKLFGHQVFRSNSVVDSFPFKRS